MLTVEEVTRLREDAIAEYRKLQQNRDNEPSNFLRALVNAECTEKRGYIRALSDVLQEEHNEES